ncbi:MAG: hypothetical protein MI919_16305 [Holophagales bacterium]|nr:hypothetical protein [Holophagales bacterium]
MQPPLDPDERSSLAVEQSAAAVVSLADAVEELLADPPADAVDRAVSRGWFRPGEEDSLVGWFARFLTVRDGLWEVLADLLGARGGDASPFLTLDPAKIVRAELGDDSRNDSGDVLTWRAFVLGYAAACAVVRLDRFLLERLAVHSVTQRKLNQGFEELRIPRKRYTAIFESFTDPGTALLLEQAIRTRWRLDPAIRRSSRDPYLSPVIHRLPALESSLDRRRRHFLRLFARFQGHALRRRGATLRDHGLFSLLESGGRFASEIRDRWRPKAVDEDVRRRLQELLRPGDVLVTRHTRALTNLFLPGFWPHAALHVGTETDRRRLGVAIEPRLEAFWTGPNRVLEALADGVRFRPLEQTLAVDAVALIRPRLSEAGIADALGRATRHAGKGYNFDFDFFRSDRLVCTEVIYRAFDGVEGLELPLGERAGRPTLSAEDLLDLALDTPTFELVALFGAPEAPTTLLEGPEAREPLERSYRQA